MENFTPLSALAGGLLIGAAASLLLWLNGRIAGVSGVLGGLWGWRPGERTWRLLFLAGLVLGAWGWQAASGTTTAPREGLGAHWLVLAGLLTGWGTSMAHGCTSGHGVCGLARLSVRSLAATVTFLLVAVLTTWLTRHVWGLPT
jgi:uncharacterized membrane protein YedE/YeeE